MAAAGQLGQDHGELVTPHSCHRIGRTHTGLYTPPGLHQQQVTTVVTQRVIDFLEVVQVDEQDGQLLLVAFALLDLLLQSVAQHAAVGQAGQRIVKGLLAYQCLGLFAAGDVGEGADHAQRFAFNIAADDHAAAQHPFPRAVFAQDAALALVAGRAAFKMVQPRLVQLLHVIRVGTVVKLFGAVVEVDITKAAHLQ